jgi:hypothetical protein
VVEEQGLKLVSRLCQGPKARDLSWVRLIDNPLEVGVEQDGVLEVDPVQFGPLELGRG